MNAPMCKAVFLFGVSACTLLGSSLTLGLNTGGNSFPFAGPYDDYPGTRYQEANAATDFSGPISVTRIDFFVQAGEGGDLYAATYTLSLSTVTADINSLSNTNFNNNLGPDNTVFDSVALSGAAPSELTFTGSPFNYNPADGNLLLDIQIVGGNGVL